MLSWFQRPRVKKLSLQSLIDQYRVLQSSDDPTKVVESLRLVAELMIWGDQHDEALFSYVRRSKVNTFRYFCEKQFLIIFLRCLQGQQRDFVAVQVLQTLSMMIQNFRNTMSLFYLFSNNHINDIIVHEFNYGNEEILTYFVSFLKAISIRLDPSILHFFFDCRTNDFPLFAVAGRFLGHSDPMVRNAVRSAVLNVLKLDSTPLRAYLEHSGCRSHFFKTTLYLQHQCLSLIEKNESLSSSYLYDEVEDTCAFLSDVIALENPSLCQSLVNQLLAHVVCPLVNELEKTNPSAPLAILLVLMKTLKSTLLLQPLLVILLRPNLPQPFEKLRREKITCPISSTKSLSYLITGQQKDESGLFSISVPQHDASLSRAVDNDVLKLDLNLTIQRSNAFLLNTEYDLGNLMGNDLATTNPFRSILLGMCSVPSIAQTHALAILHQLVSNRSIDAPLLSFCGLLPLSRRAEKRLMEDAVFTEDQVHRDVQQSLVQSLATWGSSASVCTETLKIATILVQQLIIGSDDTEKTSALVEDHLLEQIQSAATRLVDTLPNAEFKLILQCCELISYYACFDPSNWNAQLKTIQPHQIQRDVLVLYAFHEWMKKVPALANMENVLAPLEVNSSSTASFPCAIQGYGTEIVMTVSENAFVFTHTSSPSQPKESTVYLPSLLTAIHRSQDANEIRLILDSTVPLMQRKKPVWFPGSGTMRKRTLHVSLLDSAQVEEVLALMVRCQTLGFEALRGRLCFIGRHFAQVDP